MSVGTPTQYRSGGHIVKAFIKPVAGAAQQLPGIFVSDAGVYLLLALSLIAAITSALAQGLQGMDEDLRGMLTHGLMILNGGTIESQRAYL